MFNRITCILVHNEFKFLCVPSQLSLRLTNIPCTGNFLISNRIRKGFFSNGKYSASNKIIGKLSVCFWLSCHILELLFFDARIFFNAALNVSFTPTICNFFYLDFVFPFFLFAEKVLGSVFFGFFSSA